jgi:hypothetical protein
LLIHRVAYNPQNTENISSHHTTGMVGIEPWAPARQFIKKTGHQ